MKWTAEMPANIALIKYMGKSDPIQNQPLNTSLSYTLEHLVSRVEIEECEGNDRWEPLPGRNLYSLELDEHGQEKYLRHLNRVKETYGCKKHFLVRSANNFPSDCGLASSASSFAALTVCAYRAVTGEDNVLNKYSELSCLSRMGSGSSTRSFWGPWVLWNEDGAEQIKLPIEKLYHQVVIVGDRPKMVSSRKAHERVSSSLLYTSRGKRAEIRLQNLIASLKTNNWHKAFDTTWAEFQDMHALFETSQPPFGYFNSGTLAVLNVIREHWMQENDGPLVTMDAGPNIHLLYRTDQQPLLVQMREQFKQSWRVLCEIEMGVWSQNGF